MILLLELSFNKKLKSISSDNFSTYYNNYFLLFACQIEYFSGGGLERQLFVTNIVFFKLTWNQLVAIIVRLKNFTCLCNRSLHIRVNNDYLKTKQNNAAFFNSIFKFRTIGYFLEHCNIERQTNEQQQQRASKQTNIQFYDRYDILSELKRSIFQQKRNFQIVASI